MIKQPTYRKVINRGFTPIRYYTDGEHKFCWIEKVGTKLIHVRFVTGRLRRVRKSEARYMKAINKHGATTPLSL